MRINGERPLMEEERNFLRGLYQNHYRALFDYACHLGIGREAAEDYVQDAFMTAIRHIGELRQAKNPRRYLNQALKNVIGYRLRSIRYAVGLQKKLQDEAERLAAEPHRDELSPETLLGGSVNEAELKLLIRFYLEGWSQKELAAELGITENACQKRIARAKEHLRCAMEEDRSPGPETPAGPGGTSGERREGPE